MVYKPIFKAFLGTVISSVSKMQLNFCCFYLSSTYYIRSKQSGINHIISCSEVKKKSPIRKTIDNVKTDLLRGTKRLK